MDLIRCTLDNEIYNSYDFARFPLDKIEKLRHYLICNHCDENGYYRQEASDGKKPCFGAYHTEDCPEHSINEGNRKSKAVLKLVNKIYSSKEILNLDLGHWDKNKELRSGDLENGNNRSSALSQKKYSLDPSARKISNLKLASILKCLTRSPSFSQSNILINTGFKHPFKAKNLFVNFKKVDEKTLEALNNKTWRGYWGDITSCTKDWIKCKNVLIPTDKLNQPFFDKVKQKSKIVRCEEFRNWHILIFSSLRISKNNKLIIQSTEQTPFAIIRPK